MDGTSQPDFTASAVPSANEIDAISSRRFSSSFRGWNSDEVRVHLVEITEMVRALAQRHGELERQLTEAEAAVRRADLTRLDPDEVGRVMGEETARVLRTARESAAEIEAKASAQAELLTTQAADDAARTRATARNDAERVRAEAEETASAVRIAGEAHVGDVRAAAEAELADERTVMEDQLAAERQTMLDEVSTELAVAKDEAADVQRVAAEDAERVRSEADAYAQRVHGEADSQVAADLAAAEDEARELTTRAATQVAAAERLRDRILGDLARKRRAARQHLEQLHAGRTRLLTAYEVIRVTTDHATGELDVVLADAKRSADDAARRVGGEALPTPEEMLAELDAARAEDPTMGVALSPTVDDDGYQASSVDDLHGPPADAGDTDESEAPPAEAEDGDNTDAESGPVADVRLADTGTEVEPDRVAEPGPVALEPRPANRRQNRRGIRRGDPLGGESLPEAPMMPVAAAAEFESVRVMSPAEAAEAIAAAEPEAEPKPASGPEGSIAGPEPIAETPAPNEPVPDEPVPNEAEPAPSPPDDGSSAAAAQAPETDESAQSGTPVVSEDPVTDIFARLRADRARETEITAESKPKTPVNGQPPAPAPAPAPAPVPAPEVEVEKPTEPKSAAKPPAMPASPARAKRTGAKQQTDRVRSAPARPTKGADQMASLFERRDAAVDDAARRLSKHLKRQLSDHQSELLDELRRAKSPASSSTLIDATEFTAGWGTIVEADLAGAVDAAVAVVADIRPGTPATVEVDLKGPVDELIETIAAPLRNRLARVLDEHASESEVEAADDRDLADRIRACYREWRGARLTSAVADVSARAFGLGVRAAAPADSVLYWYCGPGGNPCSDCNDNQLAGGVAAGETFPTGQPVAPAHPGCSCLALPELT